MTEKEKAAAGKLYNANYNCMMLDAAHIRFGNNVWIDAGKREQCGTDAQEKMAKPFLCGRDGKATRRYKHITKRNQDISVRGVLKM